jgi:hypothetical protein
MIQEIIPTIQISQPLTYELWEFVYDSGSCMPLFLLERGPLEFLIIKMTANEHTIITDNQGNIIKTNGNYYE